MHDANKRGELIYMCVSDLLLLTKINTRDCSDEGSLLPSSWLLLLLLSVCFFLFVYFFIFLLL